MKINLKTVLLLVGLSLIMSGPCVFAHTDVTAQQARELIDSTDDLAVIDVREPSEYCGTRGHIPGALNYPLSSGVLHDRYEELPMDGPILVVCQSGGRSNQAATFLDSQGFSMVYDMMGGMNSWIWETELCIEAEEKYSGGTGEPNDPYQIATAEDLITLGETPEDYDKHFILTANIDLDPNLPGRRVFEKSVIAPDTNDIEWDFQGASFTGVFDGNGHTLSHLTIAGGDYVGLFGHLESEVEVKDLGVVDVNITGLGDYVGGLVGYSDGGTVNQCYSTGTVSGNDNVGGLVGVNAGSITSSYNSGAVSGNHGIGGLVGWNRGGIGMSYSTGSVSGASWVGGLLGTHSNIAVQCFSTARVSGSSSVLIGGLIGNNQLSFYQTRVLDCFWDTQTSGQATSDGGTGKTTAEMQTAGTFLEAGWDFVGETENGTEDIWSICEGTNYPRFVWQIPVGDFVCPDGITVDDFSFFMEHWLDDNCDLSNGYCQGTDLNQSGTVDITDLEIFFENWSAEQK